MTRFRLGVLALLLAVMGAGTAFALAGGPSTLSVCATTPTQTIAANGKTIAVLPGQQKCATTTVPTVTITTTAASTPPSTTSTPTTTTPDATTVVCDRTASPGDSVQTLVNALTSGQVGCLLPGSYTGDVTFQAGGVTLTSADPANPATVKGTLYVPPAAQHVTIDSLHIDGTNIAQADTVQLFGSYATLTHCDVTGGDVDRIGVQVGYQTQVQGVEVAYNRIHDFGIPSSQYDHGIYLDNADGTQVHDNYVFHNLGGYGVQLWTASENAHVSYNTFSGNGRASVIIGGNASQGTPSSGNEFDHNIFASPVDAEYNVRVFFSTGEAGSGNTVHDNVYQGGGFEAGPGVSYTNNVAADPEFTDWTAGDYTLKAGSPAAGYGVRP